MTKTSNRRSGLKLAASRNWIIDIEPYERAAIKTFDDVNDDLRLKRALQRAVSSIEAPQSLIDSIRANIRK